MYRVYEGLVERILIAEVKTKREARAIMKEHKYAPWSEVWIEKVEENKGNK